MKGKGRQNELVIIVLLVALLGAIAFIVSQRITHTQTQTEYVVLPKQDTRDNHIVIDRHRRINIPTRGELPAFRNIGYIANNDKNSEIEVLSLYGRPTYRGSNKWNYYTSHEGVRIPVENCDKPRGCNEKMNDENVSVDALGSDFKVSLYKDDAPRYIPY